LKIQLRKFVRFSFVHVAKPINGGGEGL
jgi:hypothetical protein